MKYFSILVLLFAWACSTQQTLVSGSWTNPNEKKTYGRILVASLTSNTVARATVEGDLANELQKKGVFAEKSIDRFPPNISETDTDKTHMMEGLRKNETDAILTVSLLNQESESHYVPGTYSYNPYSGYNYYRSFWGYYSYWHPYVYEPGYYVTDKTYYIETNLYDAATEDLIWSAQSSTYNPVNLNDYSRDFARTIVAEMQKSGILGARGGMRVTGQR